MDELVSVVVISYNSVLTIIETLDSILAQDYNNIELIISDDGSVDGTVRIVDSWIKQNNNAMRIKLITVEQNTGVPGNCNRGLGKCSGVAVKFIAADDVLESHAITSFYEAFKTDRKNIYMSKVELFGEDSVIQKKYCSNSYKKIREAQQYRNLLISNFLIAPAIGFIDIDLLKKYGPYDMRFRYFEDYPMYLKLSKGGCEFKLIDKKLVRYRVSSSSLGNKMSKGYMRSLSLFFFKEKIKLLFKEKMYITMAKQLVRYSIMYIRSL